MNISAHITHTIRRTADSREALQQADRFESHWCEQEPREAASACSEIGAEPEHRAALTNSERVCLVAIWFASAGLMVSILWHVGSILVERFQ